MPLVSLCFVHIRRSPAGCGNLLDRNWSVSRREDDHVIATPGAPEAPAAIIRNIAQRLRRATDGGNLLQSALREESNVTAVRRPERVRCAFRKRHRLRLKRIERAQP